MSDLDIFDQDTSDSDSYLTVEGFLLMFKDREWAKEAACRGMGPDLFFPDRGASPNQGRYIREICGPCPVRQECLDYGAYETHGWWGGMPVRDRQRARSGRTTR